MKRVWIATALAMSLTIADSVAKHAIIAALPKGSVDVVPNVLALQLHMNPGIIGDIAVPQIILIPVSLAVMVACFFWLAHAWNRREVQTACALVVLLLGAIGNVSDRLADGFTTDYILLFERSVINLSDVLIVVGIGWLIALTNKATRASRRH